jgi:ubiquitin-protein ligase/Mg-chelatase subunit ChlD
MKKLLRGPLLKNGRCSAGRLFMLVNKLSIDSPNSAALVALDREPHMWTSSLVACPRSDQPYFITMSEWQVVDDSAATFVSIESTLALDVAFLRDVFPDKSEEKLAKWAAVLADEEVCTDRDARPMFEVPDGGEAPWDKLQLPAAVRAAIRSRVLNGRSRQASTVVHLPSAVPSSVAPALPPVQQLDCIVLDVSASMKSRSAMDPLKTREDVSKLMFHTMVDKILALEMDHAVGLISFGLDIAVVGGGVTREYERFHDELGRLDARQGRTKLWDAILLAADTLEAHRASAPPGSLVDNCPLRIFALTDGEDNQSTSAAHQVAQQMQQRGIIVDAFPLGNVKPMLQSVASATGGLCVRVSSEEQGLGLFESEALLHVASRDEAASVKKQRKPVETADDLETFVDQAAVVEGVRKALPKQLLASPVVSAAAVAQMRSAGSGGAATKRILKEFADIQQRPDDRIQVYIAEGDVLSWKTVLKGRDEGPYKGTYYMLTFQFPQDYPFSPPKVRFVTPIYHCNVNKDGALCLDILKDQWSPALTTQKVLLSIDSLLGCPNADDPLDAFKAQLYRTDRAKYMAEATAFAGRCGLQSMEEAVATYNLGT